jgi:hypothetical protein
MEEADEANGSSALPPAGRRLRRGMDAPLGCMA